MIFQQWSGLKQLSLLLLNQFCETNSLITISGVNAIIFNTVTIFDAAEDKVDRYLSTNIVGAVQLVATFSKSKKPNNGNVSTITFYDSFSVCLYC